MRAPILPTRITPASEIHGRANQLRSRTGSLHFELLIQHLVKAFELVCAEARCSNFMQTQQEALPTARSKKQVALGCTWDYCIYNQAMSSSQQLEMYPRMDSKMYPKMYKMRTPSLFIHHQIANLRVLTELLSAHVEGLSMPNAVSREALLCRESMLTISVLLSKLEATRRALQPLEEEEGLQQRQRVCENCD